MLIHPWQVRWIVPFYARTKLLEQIFSKESQFDLLQRNLWVVLYLIIFFFCFPSSMASITSPMHTFINSVSEKGFFCLPWNHVTLDEACIARSCCVIDFTMILLEAWYGNFNWFSFVVLTSVIWGWFCLNLVSYWRYHSFTMATVSLKAHWSGQK